MEWNEKRAPLTTAKKYSVCVLIRLVPVEVLHTFYHECTPLIPPVLQVTYAGLLDRVQASENELQEGLERLDACCIEGMYIHMQPCPLLYTASHKCG